MRMGNSIVIAFGACAAVVLAQSEAEAAHWEDVWDVTCEKNAPPPIAGKWTRNGNEGYYEVVFPRGCSETKVVTYCAMLNLDYDKLAELQFNRYDLEPPNVERTDTGYKISRISRFCKMFVPDRQREIHPGDQLVR